MYSDSPHWKEYVETQWLPKYQQRAVVLNWSARRMWSTDHRLEATIFRRWAGQTEFNPVAIILPRRGSVRVIHFLHAFKDYKHGKDVALHQTKHDLEVALHSSLSLGA